MYIIRDYVKPLRAINALPLPTARKVEAEGMACLYTSPKTKLVSRMPLTLRTPQNAVPHNAARRDYSFPMHFYPLPTPFWHYSYPYAPALSRPGIPLRLRKSLEARGLSEVFRFFGLRRHALADRLGFPCASSDARVEFYLYVCPGGGPSPPPPPPPPL